MNLRDRAWRDRIREMIARLDAFLEGDVDWETHAAVRTLRDRLAGSLGAEEGWTSTPELRARAAADYAEAAGRLGLDVAPLTPPAGDPPDRVLARGYNSFKPDRPRRGDRT